MKLFQKTWFAWLLTAVMIAVAVGIGLSKGPASNTPAPAPGLGLDESLSTQNVQKFFWDDVHIFSSSTQRQINLYNANWDYRYNSVVAIATTQSPGGSLEDFAWDCGSDMGLGEGGRHPGHLGLGRRLVRGPRRRLLHHPEQPGCL